MWFTATPANCPLQAKTGVRYNQGVHGSGTWLRKISRRVVAAAFLVFMLAEWGSHTVVHINSSGSGSVVAASGSHRDDPCDTHIHCCDSRRHDRQLPGISHDLMPIVSLSDAFTDVLRLVRADEERPLPHYMAAASTRPPDPHFRPPEFA